jgi:ABC transporter substrate binding protein
MPASRRGPEGEGDRPPGTGLWLGLLWLLLVCLSAGLARADAEISLILSDQGKAYREVAETFRSSSMSHRPDRVLYLDELRDADLAALSREPGLLVPVGLKATKSVAGQYQGTASVLALMVPRSGYEAIDWPAGTMRRRLSAVFIDQPPARSLGLVESLFPRATKVAIVVSETPQVALKPMLTEAARRRLSLVQERVDDPVGVAAALRRVLPEADVMLLVPDATVINAGNVQNVLITTYRYRVPVVGFSQGLVGAGVVAAVFSTPSQIGRQGASIAARWSPASADLPPAEYCDEFSIDFNPYVARSLGVVLPDADEVRRKLGAAP